MRISRFLFAGAIALALATAGCAQVNTGLQLIISTLSTPAASTAVSNIKSTVDAFACGLSAAAAAAQTVEKQSYDGAPLVDESGQEITAIVYASSAIACSTLGGVVTSPTPVTVPSTDLAA